MSIELISNQNPNIFNYNLIEPSVSETNSVFSNKQQLADKLGILQSKIKLNKLANSFKSKSTRLERKKNELKRKQFNLQPKWYNRGDGSGCEPFGGD